MPHLHDDAWRGGVGWAAAGGVYATLAEHGRRLVGEALAEGEEQG